MLLSVAVHVRSLRWFVPEFLLLGSAPIYVTVWSAWRLLTAVLPTKAYVFGDDIMWSSYQRFILFFVENVSGLKVYLYGDAEEILKGKENVIYMSNHQSTVDWVVTDMLAVRQGSMGHIRYILKDGLKYLPLYGFYFKQHGSIYVKRSGKFNRQRAARQLTYLSKHNIPMWLVVFPEGTRFNPELPGVIEKSRQFAADKGLTPFTQLLTPRIKALQLAVEELNDYVDAVYDVTVGYSNTQNLDTGERTTSPGVPEALAGYSSEIHIHVNRIDIKEVPREERELRNWLHELFQKKERMMLDFYSTDPNQRGKFSGKSQLSKLGLMQTFPSALFWGGLLVATLSTQQGRSLYWKIGLGAVLGGIAYSAVRS